MTVFKKRTVYGILAAGAIIFLAAAFVAVSILYGVSWSDVTAPMLLGNGPENIERLTGNGSDVRPFSFLVAGDTRSSTVFEDFYQNTSLDIDPDFGVIVGDFVAYPDANRHRFFMGEFGEWEMTFPIFVITGNHDVVTKHERMADRLYDPVSREDFERMYGPRNFSFIYRGCLFIGIDDAYTADYLDYLKETLSRRPKDVLMTFVFMHIPPPSLIEPSAAGREMEGEQEFLRLMDAYDVDFVFTGDFHSYFRADRGHTRYIITGGGGSPIRANAARSFHHAILMTVDPARDRADETIYSFRPTLDVGDDIEIVMICGIYPIFERHPYLWAAVFALVAASAAGLIAALLVRMLNKGRAAARTRP
jgi:3',5'-cyclic AMP phosphodiesterase CpdA